MPIKDLVEEWIQMRSTLRRQLELLKSAEMHTGTNGSDTTQETIARIEKWISELNALLKENARGA
jgi:hypothetical protein